MAQPPAKARAAQAVEAKDQQLNQAKEIEAKKAVPVTPPVETPKPVTNTLGQALGQKVNALA